MKRPGISGLILAHLLLALMANAQDQFIPRQDRRITGSGAQSFTPLGVLLSTGPNHVWQFDGTTTQTDYVGGVNLSTPAGVVSNASPIGFGPAASCYVPSSARFDTGSSNVNNFNFNQSFAYCFFLSQSNIINGTNFTRYMLAGNLSGSPTNGYEIALSYNSGDTTPDKTPIPPTWATLTLSFWMGNGNEIRFTSAMNIPVGQPSIIGVCWNTNSPAQNGQLQVYLNGNFINASRQTFAFNSTNSTSTAHLCLLNRPNFSAPYAGGVQLIASWTNVVTEQQFLQIYLAYALGQSYAPGTWLYSTYKGMDTLGNQIQISTPATYWYAPESRYYIFGQQFATDVQIPSGAWDATNSNKIAVYTSPSLAQGTFTPFGTGIACDCSVIPNIWSAERPSVVYNPNKTNFVMAIHQRNYPLGSITNYFYDIATSTNIGGPYTLVVTNQTMNGTNPADMSMFTDVSGSNAYLMWNFNNTNWVSKTDTNFQLITGTLAFLPNSLGEGPCEVTINGIYHFFYSTSEYYNSILASNTFWYTALSPLGPYFGSTSLYGSNNPSGSGFEGQGGGAPFMLQSSGTVILPFDNWHNGALTNSPVSYGILNVLATNQALPPVDTVTLLKEIPMATNVPFTNSFARITRGLQNSYRFNNTLNDSQGSANWTAVGSPPFSTNFAGTASTSVSLNGTTQWLTNAMFNLNAQQHFTVSVWFCELADSSYGTSISDYDGSKGLFTQWGPNATDPNIYCTFPDGKQVVVPYANFGGELHWVQLVWRANGTIDQMFQNDQLVGSQTESTMHGSPNWWLSGFTEGTPTWHGLVGEINVFNIDLTDAEVYTNYMAERISP